MKRASFFALVSAFAMGAAAAASPHSPLRASPAYEHSADYELAMRRARIDAGHRALLVTESAVPLKDFMALMPEGYHVAAWHENLFVVEGPVLLGRMELDQLAALPGVVGVRRDFVVTRRAPKANDRRPASVESHETETKASDKTAPPKPDPCGLGALCPNKEASARYWAQESLEADLMKDYLRGKYGETTETRTKVAVVDSGFDRKQAPNFNTKVVSKAGVVKNDNDPRYGDDPKEARKVMSFSWKGFIGDPDQDEAGHGTMVASCIAGKGPLGVAENVDLSVYRVTEPGDTGATSNAFLQISIDRACSENPDPSGLTIINVSWGGREDEAGLEREESEPTFKRLLKKWSDKGCLVVKAAGNDNFRSKRVEDNLDDNYLRVSATDSHGHIARFSSVGEVAAPGQSIYVLESTTMTEPADSDKRCDPKNESSRAASPRRFISGTSFAAPLTAGIASQVVRVLKSAAWFSKLDTAQRIALVNHLLKGSMLAGQINGLRAVRYAEYWNDACSSARNSLPVEKLRDYDQYAQEKPETVCTAAHGACRDERDCVRLKGCISDSRRRIALCSQQPAGRFSADAVDLARAAYAQGLPEMGGRFGHYAFLSDAKSDPAAAADMTRLAVAAYLKSHDYDAKNHDDQLFGGWKLSGMSTSFMANDLVDHFHNCIKENQAAMAAAARTRGREPEYSAECNPWTVYSLLRGALLSPEFSNFVSMGRDRNNGEDRGSGEIMDVVSRLVAEARRVIGDPAINNILSYFVKFHAHSGSVSSNKESVNFATGSPSVPARLLDRLIRDNEGSDSHFTSQLRGLEENLVDWISQTNYHFLEKTERSPLYIERFPERTSFDGFLERHPGPTEATLKDGVWERLSPIEVASLLARITAGKIQSPQSEEICFGLLATAGKGRGWGAENDTEYTKNCLTILDKVGRAADAARKAQLKDRLVQALEGARNMGLLHAFLLDYERNEAVNFDRELYGYMNDKAREAEAKALHMKDHSLLDEAHVAKLRQALVLGLAASDPKTLELYTFAVGGEFHLVFDEAIRAPLKPTGQKMRVPAMKLSKSSRLDAPDAELTMTMEQPDRSETLDRLMTWLLKACQNPKTRLAGEYYLHDIALKDLDYNMRKTYDKSRRQSANDFMDALPQNGEWRKVADAIVSAPGRDDTGGVRSLKDFLKLYDDHVAKNPGKVAVAKAWNAVDTQTGPVPERVVAELKTIDNTWVEPPVPSPPPAGYQPAPEPVKPAPKPVVSTPATPAAGPSKPVVAAAPAPAKPAAPAAAADDDDDSAGIRYQDPETGEWKVFKSGKKKKKG